MSQISILGSGRVATALAGALIGAGHDITLGVREPARVEAGWTGPAVTITDPATAARTAPIVINTTPGETSLPRLTALRQELAGTILIDVSNAVEHGADGMPGTLSYPTSSLAEKLQDALPATAVVKTLNTMLFSVMTDPGSLGTPATVFLSGNEAEAKSVVRGLLTDLGWPDSQILDLGDVRTARGPESMILLVPDIIRSRGFAPFAITVAV
jgi:predicted dinucleotide-binding enzyme